MAGFVDGGSRRRQGYYATAIAIAQLAGKSGISLTHVRVDTTKFTVPNRSVVTFRLAMVPYLRTFSSGARMIAAYLALNIAPLESWQGPDKNYI